MVGGNIVSRGFGYDNRIVARGYVERLVPVYRPILVYSPVDSIYFKTRLTQNIVLFPTISFEKELRTDIPREVFHIGTSINENNPLHLSINMVTSIRTAADTILRGNIVTEISKSAIMDKDNISIEETGELRLVTSLNDTHSTISNISVKKQMSTRIYQEET